MLYGIMVACGLEMIVSGVGSRESGVGSGIHMGSNLQIKAKYSNVNLLIYSIVFPILFLGKHFVSCNGFGPPKVVVSNAPVEKMMRLVASCSLVASV